MKKFILPIFLCFAAATVLAQSTLFTYQGRLNDGASSANGAYDIRFTLYDAAENGTPLAVLTNAPTAISNGLFTVQLDFGMGAFDGAARWLEIAVRTNGSLSAYTALSPLQQITATPYAMLAGNASNLVGTVTASQVTGSLPVTQLSGTINDTQLSANIPRLSNGLLSDAVFSTNIARVGSPYRCETVTDLSVQAMPNTHYIVTNATQVTVQLPTNCNVGDIVRVIASSGSGGWKIGQAGSQRISGASLEVMAATACETTRPWREIACSADGTKVIACAPNTNLFVSVDSGATWVARGDTNRNWGAVGCSADGQKMFAGGSGTKIYVSEDGGTNWTERASVRSWRSFASSSDGSRVVAADGSGFLYVSSDSGTNWTARAINSAWESVAISSDGSRMLAGATGAQIYSSSDYGTTWIPRDTIRTWFAVCGSSDLLTSFAAAYNDSIYFTSNQGFFWGATLSGAQTWSTLACNTNASVVFAATFGGPLLVSADRGMTWKPRAASRQWYGIACSADGRIVYGVASEGQIYKLDATQTETSVGATGYIVGGKSASIELQYIGEGVFATVNHEGSIQAF